MHGGLKFFLNGAIIPNAGEPRVGEALYFASDGRDLVTSPLEGVERPSKDLVEAYPTVREDSASAEETCARTCPVTCWPSPAPSSSCGVQSRRSGSCSCPSRRPTRRALERGRRLACRARAVASVGAVQHRSEASFRYAEASARDWDNARACRFGIRDRKTRRSRRGRARGFRAPASERRARVLAADRRDRSRVHDRGLARRDSVGVLHASRASHSRGRCDGQSGLARRDSAGSGFASRASRARPSVATDAGSITPCSACSRPTRGADRRARARGRCLPRCARRTSKGPCRSCGRCALRGRQGSRARRRHGHPPR